MLVKSTASLFNKINENIDKLYIERLKIAHTLKGISEAEILEKAYEITHSPERLAALKLLNSTHPKIGLSDKSNHFQFIASFEIDGKIKQRAFEGTLSKEREVMHDFGNRWATSPVINYLPTYILEPIIASYLETKAIENERDVFKEAFTTAWKKVKSVNELIKLWPAVSDLLEGTDVVERINRKTGPRVKSDEVLFDSANLSVQLLKAKVAK